MATADLEAFKATIGNCPPLSADAERVLAERMQAGDIEARDRLFASVAKWVFKLAMANKPKWLDADEALSFANAEVLRRLPKFDPSRGRLTTFIAAMLPRLMRRPYDRGESRLMRRAVSLDNPGVDGRTLAGSVPTSEDFERLSEHRDEMSDVRANLRHLSEREREVVELRLQGLSAAEIADRWGISTCRFYQLESRAVDRLRRAIGVAC